MFKNILLFILTASTILFAWLAIRNSEPLNCASVLILDNQNICIVNANDLPSDQFTKEVKQTIIDNSKYINE